MRWGSDARRWLSLAAVVMALSCKVGTITEPATTGNQAYTGVGFQPVALLIWSEAQRTADGAQAGARLTIGVGTSATARNAIAVESRDAQATADTNRYHDTAGIVRVIATGDSTITAAADLVSLDSDGFTLNWTDVHDSGSARLYHYLALGGADLTNAKAGSFTSSGSGGNQGVTGVGFQPDCVLLLGTAHASTGLTGQNIFGFGAFTASDQWAIGMDDVDNAATTNAARTQRTDKCWHHHFNGSEFHSGAFTSMDSDGFTINWSRASGRTMTYLALKGGQFTAGSISQKTSTGTQGYTGVGFPPVGVLLASFCNTSTTSQVDSARFSLGAASGATSRAATWFGSADNQADSVSDSATSQTVAITMQTEGTPTEVARADLDSFDADGFTLDWEAADATAREILYLAMGSVDEGGGGEEFVPFPRPRGLSGGLESMNGGMA